MKLFKSLLLLRMPAGQLRKGISCARKRGAPVLLILSILTMSLQLGSNRSVAEDIVTTDDLAGAFLKGCKKKAQLFDESRRSLLSIRCFDALFETKKASHRGELLGTRAFVHGNMIIYRSNNAISYINYAGHTERWSNLTLEDRGFIVNKSCGFTYRSNGEVSICDFDAR